MSHSALGEIFHVNDLSPGMSKIGSIVFNQSPSSYEVVDSWAAMEQVTPVVTFGFSVGYIAMVFLGRLLMKNVEPVSWRPVVAVWNLFLSVFSICGAIVMLPVCFRFLMDHGSSLYSFRRFLCSPELWTPQLDGITGYWVFLFVLSKFPEMLDTFFLVVQKKPVIFLHWYHHLTVMLFTWYAYMSTAVSACFFFASMNYFVHSIMYSYYFLMSFKFTRNIIKPIAPLITTLQLAQMVGGLIINILAFIALGESDEENTCPGQKAPIVYSGTFMYASYFVLFAVLFRKMYLQPGGKHSKRGPKPNSKCPSPINNDSKPPTPANMKDY